MTTGLVNMHIDRSIANLDYKNFIITLILTWFLKKKKSHYKLSFN